jgi:hypothetical protein
MKKIIILSISLCFALSLFAQTDMSKHRLAIELGGPAAIATLEYQSVIISKNRHELSLTGGIGTTFFSYSFPLGVDYTFGSNNQLVAGIKYVPMYVSSVFDLFDDGSGAAFRSNIISPKLGYRKIMQGRKEAYYLQFYFAPVIFMNTGEFIAWGGFGVGVSL